MLRVAARLKRSAQTPAAGTPRRVLLLRPDHVGDVLLTAPAVALLRASLPASQLTYIVGPWSVAAARHGPAVDSVRTLAYPGFTRRPNPNPLQPYALLVRQAARLRRERYDLAVVFRSDHWWGALLALVAGIPVRVGGHTPETAPLLTHSHVLFEHQHAAEQALHLARHALHAHSITPVESSDVAIFEISRTAQVAADELWRRHALHGRTVVAIHPSAGARLKSWPLDHWAKLADALVSDGRAVLLVGAPDDGPLLSAIQARRARHPGATACGQSLDISAAIYRRSSIVVAVDSGAAHLAAAVGTPTVRLYGPAPPATFGPWPTRADQRVLITNRLACVPCGHLEAPPCRARSLPACLLALRVEDVLNAVRAQLESHA